MEINDDRTSWLLCVYEQVAGGLMSEHDDATEVIARHHLYFYGAERGTRFNSVQSLSIDGVIKKVGSSTHLGMTSFKLALTSFLNRASGCYLNRWSNMCGLATRRRTLEFEGASTQQVPRIDRSVKQKEVKACSEYRRLMREYLCWQVLVEKVP